MENYNQANLKSLVKPGLTWLNWPNKSGSTMVYQAQQAFNQTFGARVTGTSTRNHNSQSVNYFLFGRGI